jgi:hypothetical protein
VDGYWLGEGLPFFPFVKENLAISARARFLLVKVWDDAFLYYHLGNWMIVRGI